VLDIGCGVGLVDYELGRTRPGIRILGIDISTESIARAREHHALPNVEYASIDLEQVGGRFDCVLLVDVLHHVPPDERIPLLEAASRLLSGRGYLFIKDIERNRGQISWFLDRMVSGAPEVFLRNCDEMVGEVTQSLEVVKTEVCFRFPFPHYYIVARNRAG
jgi:2-polyprenyl-6-hydroxyphenyl methylase/3-demethylubiquinone-9 3-methyltransferase